MVWFHTREQQMVIDYPTHMVIQIRVRVIVVNTVQDLMVMSMMLIPDGRQNI